MKQNIYDNPTFFEQYNKLRKTGKTYNDFIEQPAIKKCMPPLRDKVILDFGCGAGNLAYYCAMSGAQKVLAVDISKKMLEKARLENSHNRINYIQSAMEDLEVDIASIDVIVSSLAIHYIEDYDALVHKFSAMLKEGGQLIFSTEHPMVTARKTDTNWVLNEEGEIGCWAIDHYQSEGIRTLHWFVDGVVKYHRTMTTLINTLIQHQFIITSIEEPQPIPEGLEQLPKIAHEKKRPSFLIIHARKEER